MAAYGEGLYGVGLYSSPPPTLTDWQAEYRDLTVGANTPFHLTMPIDGLADMPEMRTSDQVRQRRHGAHPGDDLLGTRTFNLTFQVIAPGALEQALSDFARAFTIGPEAPFVFRIPGVAGGGTRSIDLRCRRRSAPIDRDMHTGYAKVVVQLEATDPRIYDGTTYTEVASLPNHPAGLSWPLSWPLDFGGLPTGGRASLLNEGDFPTEVTIRIDGPVTNPRVENTTTGQVQQFDIDIAAGDWIDVDARARTVLLNGTASRYAALTRSSQWIDLAPGLNEVTFNAFAGTPDARMSMVFRSAWV